MKSLYLNNFKKNTKTTSGTGTIVEVHKIKAYRLKKIIRRTKEAATQAACVGNTRRYHSEYVNSWLNNRENDDAYYMFRSYNNCYYSSSEPVTNI